jgi:hypothetical protein
MGCDWIGCDGMIARVPLPNAGLDGIVPRVPLCAIAVTAKSVSAVVAMSRMRVFRVVLSTKKSSNRRCGNNIFLFVNSATDTNRMYRGSF